jgi:hypothetical protein
VTKDLVLIERLYGMYDKDQNQVIDYNEFTRFVYIWILVTGLYSMLALFVPESNPEKLKG